MSNYLIYFSPTGGTKKVGRILGNKFVPYREIDISRSDTAMEYIFDKDDICLVCVPSFGGRVPEIALRRMEDFKGNSARAVSICVYGNRAFDDTLAELTDFLTERGFSVAAGVAAVAEHSIMRQFAKGRPDKEDEQELDRIGEKISGMLSAEETLNAPLIPGNRPYREYNGIPIKPKATTGCTKCGVCAEGCPTGAIPEDAPDKTVAERCISCMRCVSVCPEGARKVNGPMVKLASLKMKEECKERKSNRLFKV